MEINSIQKQQHWEYQLFLSSLSVHWLRFNHLQKGWLLLYESGNIPFNRKLGAVRGFIRSYQPLFCKAFFLMTLREGWVKLAKLPTGKSWNRTAPPMTWSGQVSQKRYTRYVDDRTIQSARSQKQGANIMMQPWPCIWKCYDNVPWTWCNMSISWSLTMKSFINKREIYVWNRTASLGNSTQSKSLLQVVHFPSNVPWNMSLHS